ncbi:Uncharacterized protein APZ42_022404 [Daphnia magna]|uniref:Uncharacterized protein n=1 Tax=Daphnia magna TaxID=35525 RepID=A0A164VGB7_9CRUS|nr:Uncharacterized protein APZ42_022404 [Daphnia magna]
MRGLLQIIAYPSVTFCHTFPFIFTYTFSNMGQTWKWKSKSKYRIQNLVEVIVYESGVKTSYEAA